nr:hypothetical protein [uncultured Undibacterium sp.]
MNQMKLLSITFVAFFVCVTAASASDTTPLPRSYPMADAMGCNSMVRELLNTELESLDLPKIESAACACVDGKLRKDPIMVTLFGEDQAAVKKLTVRENFQTYLIAKSTSYMFLCMAPLLSEGADLVFKSKKVQHDIRK